MLGLFVPNIGSMDQATVPWCQGCPLPHALCSGSRLGASDIWAWLARCVRGVCVSFSRALPVNRSAGKYTWLYLAIPINGKAEIDQIKATGEL